MKFAGKLFQVKNSFIPIYNINNTHALKTFVFSQNLADNSVFMVLRENILVGDATQDFSDIEESIISANNLVKDERWGQFSVLDYFFPVSNCCLVLLINKTAYITKQQLEEGIEAGHIYMHVK